MITEKRYKEIMREEGWPEEAIDIMWTRRPVDIVATMSEFHVRLAARLMFNALDGELPALIIKREGSGRVN